MVGPGRRYKDGAPPTRRWTMTKCEHCDGTYRSGIMFQRHISKFHSDVEKKYPCNECDSKYCTMNELLHHYLKHWIEGGLCPLCTNSFTTFTRRARILAHLLEKHNIKIMEEPPSLKKQKKKIQSNETKRYLCEYCMKAFDKPSQVKRHIRIHTGERPFECEYCSANFNQKNTLVLHIMTHTNVRPHKCHLCPESFNQRGNLRSHIKCCHPLKATSNRHFCPHCPSSFRNSCSLNMHHSRLHQNLTEDKIINNTVNDVMKGLASLNSQTQKDTDILEKALFCSGISSNTNKTEKHEDVISNHRKKLNPVKSSNIKPYKCNICNKKFRQSVGLALHHHNIHNIRKKKKSPKIPIIAEPEKQSDSLQNIEDFFLKNDSSIDIDLSLLPLDYPSMYPTNNADDLTMNRDEPFQFMNVELQNQKELNSITDEILNSENQLTATLDLGNETISIENILSDQSDPLSRQFQIPIDGNIPEVPNENIIFDNNSVMLKQFQTINGQYYFDTLPTVLDEARTTVDNSDNSVEFELVANLDFDKNNQETITLEKGVDFTESIQDIPVISIVDTSIPNDGICISEPNDNKFILNCPESDITFMDIEDKLKELELQSLKKSLSLNQRGYKNPPLENRCDQCPASFSKMSDLIRHKRIHTGERPFVCEICTRGFSVKNTYKRHLRVHLAKKKPTVKCQVCGDLFANKTTYKIHMRIHTGEKPFKCPLCKEAFRTSGHRSSHLKIHFKTNGRKSKKYISELFSLNENDIK